MTASGGRLSHLRGPFTRGGAPPCAPRAGRSAQHQLRSGGGGGFEPAGGGDGYVHRQGREPGPADELPAGDGEASTELQRYADFEGDSTGEYAYNANYYLPGSASGITTTGARKLPAGVITDIGDTNGDGFGDIVIGNAWDDGAGISTGGAVEIVYGAASGPTGGKDTITQDSPGVPGGSEKGDMFGYELSLGDINGDGLQDLAVGAPTEDLGGTEDAAWSRSSTAARAASPPPAARPSTRTPRASPARARRTTASAARSSSPTRPATASGPDGRLGVGERQ
ncbi:FG-GAP repeat protein [Streptomyces hypolithicus]